MKANGGTLGERAERVLGAVIEHYMSHASPVGSIGLRARHSLPWSAATIRGEMAHLEDCELLTHAHTSGGRLPTARGIRYYVDHMLELSELPVTARERIRAQLAVPKDEPMRLMLLVAQLLSRFSQYVSLVQLAHEGSQECVVGGKENVLGEPEFSDIIKLKDLFRVLEEEDLLTRLFRRALTAKEVRVHIGADDFPAPYRELFEDVSVITASYDAQGGRMGSLGIVGPKRMDYRQMIPLVAFTARTMGQCLHEA